MKKDDLYICNKCRYETPEVLGQCPNCGRRMVSTKETRVRGWLTLVAGLIIAGLMGTITILTAPMLLQPGSEIGSTHFSGTAGQGMMMLFVFGYITAIGIITMANGFWQIKTGRRNKWLFYTSLAMIALIAMTGWLASEAFGK